MVGSLLAIHLIVANQIPLKIIDTVHHFPWCPNLLDKEKFNLAILLWSEAAVVCLTALKLWIPSPWWQPY